MVDFEANRLYIILISIKLLVSIMKRYSNYSLN